MKDYSIKKYKKFIPALLAAFFLFPFSGCGADTVQELPEAYRIPQLSETEIISLYNDGIKALTDADSYTMIGSVCDAANIIAPDNGGEAPAAVAEAITCHVSKTDGAVCADFSAVGKAETTHNTYYDGTYWYVSDVAGLEPFRSEDNLYNDFLVQDYYPQISEDAVFFTNMERVDGDLTVTMRLPLSAFASAAIEQRVGLFMEETADSTVCITMTLTEEKQPVNIAVSWSAESDFGDGELLQQALEVSFAFSDVNASVVSIPADLSAYTYSTEEKTSQNGNLDGNYAYRPPEGATDEEIFSIDWDTVTWEELEAAGWTRVPADETDLE